MIGTPSKSWLSEVVIDAQRSLIRSHTPQGLVAMGQTVTLPLPHEEAAILYDSMAKHFYAWTGKSLQGFKP